MSKIDVINAAIRANIPVILWGAPGTGKTAAIRNMGKERNVHIETLIGSTLDPTIIGGIPFPLKGENKIATAPPDWALRIKHTLDEGREAWLFADELSCSAPSVQAALLRVFHEKIVANVDIAECRIIAASNHADLAADGGMLGPPMSSRMAHIEWEMTADEWISGELSGWGEHKTAQHAAASASICGYICRNVSSLLSIPKNIEDLSGPWPNNRAWSNGAKMMACTNKMLWEDILASLVGKNAALEWAAWDEKQDLPDPELVLSGRATIPSRGDRAYAALSSVVAAALSVHKERTERIINAWKIISDMRPDVVISSAAALRKGAPEIITDEAVSLGFRLTNIS